MEEIVNTANPATVASLQQLRVWLAGKRIPTDLWGKGRMKRVEDLWSELGAGESVLTDCPPERQVSCVSLVIRRGAKQLMEVGQVLANGEIRPRHQSPAEKMLPGEDVEAAAFRCVEEELGVPRESCRVVPGTYTKKVNKGKSSPSYPGLKTRYVVHEIEMEVPGLPRTAFHTPEAAGSGDMAVVMHQWHWCGAVTYHQY
jgi:hypothetical protein